MSKDVEMLVEPSREGGKVKPKQGRKTANPMGSSGAQRHLEDDLLKNPDTVQSTTQALIDEGFLPSRRLLDDGFLQDDVYDCLTRMDKKDSATKMKALSDFLNMSSTKDPQTLVNARTFWARFFISFLEDDDPRVRELAAKCQQQFVAVLKKEILPILSRIIGPWWLAQYQMHSAASTAARSSFSSSFPDQKRADVVRRFSSEILNMLVRRIFPVHSKPSLHDRATKPKGGKTAAPETAVDMTDEQQLRIAEALDAFSGFLLAISAEGLEETRSVLAEVLEKPELWKLTRSQSPKIRQNFCSFLSALWEKKPEWMLPYTKDTLKVVVANFHERDVRTATAVWELFLLVISKSPDWQNAIDQKKILLPKLLSLLKNGGFGTASSVFPSLIVLVDKLSEKSLEVYDAILSALIQGLSVESLRTADANAICQAVCDCLQYVVKRTDRSTAETIVKNHFAPLMQTSLMESVKGLDGLQKILLNWLSRGGADAELALIVFTSLLNKVTFAAPDNTNVPRMQLWIASLVEAAQKIHPGKEHGRVVMEIWIKEHKSFQDLLYHIQRLSYLSSKNSCDPEQAKALLSFLRLINSEILYQRLKEFIEDEPTVLSPQLVILRTLPSQLTGPHLELFCILICDCRSTGEAQEMFTSTWNAASDHISLLQALEKYAGFDVVDKYFSSSHTEDLVTYSEKLLAAKDLTGFSHILALLAKLGGDMRDIGLRLVGKIDKFDVVTQLKFFRIFFSQGKFSGNDFFIYKTITTACRLAGNLETLTDAAESEVMVILAALRPYVCQSEVDWANNSILDAVRNALDSGGPALRNATDSGGPALRNALDSGGPALRNATDSGGPALRTATDSGGPALRTATDSGGPAVMEDLRTILLTLTGSSVEHLKKLCAQLADFDTLRQDVLARKDIFLVLISRIEKDEHLSLDHKYWDRQIEQIVLVCCLVLDLLPVEVLVESPELFSDLLRGVLATAAYVQLNFISEIPMVHSDELQQNLKFYQSKLAGVFGRPEVIHLIADSTSSPDELFVANPSAVSEVEFLITSRDVEDLSENDLSVAYSQLRKTSLPLSPEGSLYKSRIRDRLESILAFSTFPRTCEEIEKTPWPKIEALRLVPCLLQERCFDPDYSSAVLDVFGTVVIDWISCLQREEILEEHPKVWILLQAALEGVGFIVTAAEQLADSGMLWLELTEFSFPRILASLLDGLLRFAHASDEYLTERHPVVARLIISVCSLVLQFAVRAQESLKPVWDTMFNLEFGLPESLAPLHVTSSHIIPPLIRLFAPLLLHRVAQFQMLAADILVRLIPIFPSSYAPHDFVSEYFPGPGKLVQGTDQDTLPVEALEMLAPPVELLSVLEESAEIVETMLLEVPLGTSFGGVVPQTDSYTYMIGYLMAWRSIFAWIKNESLEAKQAFAKHLELTGSLNALLDHLVRLLPLDVGLGDGSEHPSPSAKFNSGYLSAFVASLTDVEDWSHEVYSIALQEMPMIARSWFSRKQGPIVKQIAAYTAKFISQTIVAHELTSAAGQAKHVSFHNFKVNVRPTVAEITAEYRVEVWVAEIVVKIPKDYPLGSVQVCWGRTKGSAMDAWDQWVVRLAGFLRRQNGSILDGILEWKKSVDKKFQGVEACAICLSIVDTKTAAVPQERCKTCKNKFHTECLNRWFQQQVDPTCPLCREKFFT